MSGICFNEDNSHLFLTRKAHNISAEGLEKLTEQYAGTQVNEILFNVNAMKTSFDSKVWGRIWDGYEQDKGSDQHLFEGLPEDRQSFRNWVHNAWLFYQKKIDPYEMLISSSKRLGLSPWLSMRMNDVHNVDNENLFFHSDFWKNRPDLRRIDYKFTALTDRAYDFGHKEVRDYHFRLIEEIAGSYDMDGLELDWMRHGFHFKPGYEDEGAVLLTGFMKDVRHLLDIYGEKRGRKIKLSARVPSRPQTSLGLGMDAAEWAQTGLIDMLVITPFFETIEPDMPVEIWKQLLAGTGVLLAAGMEILLSPFLGYKPVLFNSIETARGAAISLLDRGADRIYLFNYMDHGDIINEIPENERIDHYPDFFNELGQISTIFGKSRRHVLTYPDTRAPGESVTAVLPALCRKDEWKEFRIPIGPAPVDQDTFVIFGVRNAAGIEMGANEVRLNGIRCEFRGKVDLSGPKPEEDTYQYKVAEGAAHRGYNLIEIRPCGGFEVIWAEISILS